MDIQDQTRDKPARDKNGQLLPGQTSLNPGGRPKGARSKFGEDFVKAFADDFSLHGKGVIEQAREKNPDAYLRVACAILPKVIELDDDTKEAIQTLALIPFNVIHQRTEDKSESTTAH